MVEGKEDGYKPAEEIMTEREKELSSQRESSHRLEITNECSATEAEVERAKELLLSAEAKYKNQAVVSSARLFRGENEHLILHLEYEHASKDADMTSREVVRDITDFSTSPQIPVAENIPL